MKMKNKLYRSILATVVALSVVAGLGFAGLLQYYGKVVGTATVGQSVRLVNPDTGEEMECTNGDYSKCTYDWKIGNIVASETVKKIFTLRNYGKQNAPISFGVTVNPSDQGVEVKVTGVAEENGNEVCQGDAPSKVPPATDAGPGTAEFCVVVTSNIATIPDDYTVTVGIKPL